MSRWIPILLLVSACGGDPATPVVLDQEPVVRTWIEGVPERGVATLVVQVRTPADAPVSLPDPEIPRLTLTPVEQPTQERIGELVVVTRRYRISGQPGSYQIPPLSVGGPESAPIWVDLGGSPAALDGFSDIADPAPIVSVNTTLLVGAACAGLTVFGAAGAVAVAFVPGLLARRLRALPPEPPDVLALRRWEAVRADLDLDDHQVAVAIAAILREYIEAVLSLPATSMTTREILDRLRSMPLLPEGNVGRAERILRATDYIKFADRKARATLFDELDDALRTFIGSTRPRSIEGAP